MFSLSFQFLTLCQELESTMEEELLEKYNSDWDGVCFMQKSYKVLCINLESNKHNGDFAKGVYIL